MNKKIFENWVKTTQFESLGTNKDLIINLRVNLVKHWKN
jgi:hypothetical protein